MEKSIYSKEYSLFLEQLRNAREEKGLTQTELAERLGQTQSFISKVERGERRIDIVELRAFCSAIDVGFASFIARIDKVLNGK
ncbi:MAG TPA: helix-turn-helix transcriptional regulator [Pyrinomonadaceae bacterium]|nr:helix-turn-helix transcriptional regulator [Pyrinomonadaceae bacterium]HMP65254.1 helix-turn-helix transcriptional regulator [Pyrinomonadaceae bacterium]